MAMNFYPGSDEQPGDRPNYVIKLERLRAEGNWSAYIYSCETIANKLDIFVSIQHRLTDAEYWELLAGLWTNSKTSPSRTRASRQRWLALLQSTRGSREHLMSHEDHEQLASLPDPVTIYRGVQLGVLRGLSWTYDFERAVWFARRFPGRTGKVVRATVPKSRILACWADPEAEVVINPVAIRFVQVPCPEISGGKDQ